MACVRRGKLLFSSFASSYRSSFDAQDSSRLGRQLLFVFELNASRNVNECLRMYQHQSMWQPVHEFNCEQEARCQGHTEWFW